MAPVSEITPTISLGFQTYNVPMSLHYENRTKVTLSLVPLTPPGSVIFLKGGGTPLRFDTDHEPIFRQESYFHYLFGVKEPDISGCIVIHEDGSHESVLFIPHLNEDYATVMGRIKTPSDVRAEYAVDTVIYEEEMENYLSKRLSQDGNTAQLLLLQGKNSDSGNSYTPPTFQSPALSQKIDTTFLFSILANARVLKSPTELSLLRHVTEVTSLAHVYIMKQAKPNMREYQFESLFRHYCYYHFGHRNLGYTPICGCGPSGAVLHYGHAGRPNDGTVLDGDMCLFDLGSEYRCYGSDVTCSFPINGTFTEKQRAVFEGVLSAQIGVMSMLKAGVSWVDCHLKAEECILMALQKLGVVRSGNVSVMVEKRLGAIFMPHGLGHFIGCDTHDVGGYLEGYPERSDLPGLKSLRTARVMEAGMVVTVEPGCYFIDHLMDKVMKDEGLREHVNEERLKEFRGFGGVRLEDVVLVKEHDCENFTRCPRTVDEIESVMAGGKWPPLKDVEKRLKRTRLTAAD